MQIKDVFLKIRDDYVIHQVARAKVPAFRPGVVCRLRFVFSGRVQNVGFRLEAAEMADRLELTGFCENLPNGDVLLELQGAKNRIAYLVFFLRSLTRIRVEHVTATRLPINPTETVFIRGT
ncbi:MAG: acylphosphatase [Butyricicoccus sp.]|nr:acylphosphatase [Butyricicoccus sp.]